MFDAIERWCGTLAALGYDMDRLVRIELELRAVAGWLRGYEVRK